MKYFMAILIAFLLIHPSFAKAEPAPTKANSKTPNTYVRVDAKSGQIQLVAGNQVLKSSYIVPEDIKFTNNFRWIDTSDAEKNMPSDSKKAEQLKKLIQEANALNMKEAWLSGQRFVVVEGQSYPVNLKEMTAILKYMSYKKIKEASERDPSIKLQNYSPELKPDEIQMLDSFENKIKLAAQEISEGEEALVRSYPAFDQEDKNTETSYQKMVSNMKTAAQANSTVVIALIDTYPYLLTTRGSAIKYASAGSAGGSTLAMKSADGNLVCSGMAQVQQPPTANNIVTFKIDFNFVRATYFSYRQTSPAEAMAVVDTINHNTVCNPGADRIFQAGFEAGER